MSKIDFKAKFEKFESLWSPRIVAEMNGQYVKVAKAKGELMWHTHDREDEFFLVLKGRLRVHLRDRVITLDPAQGFVVPRGVEHKPSAEEETHFLLIEPKTTLHTGDTQSERTVGIEDQEWV